MKRIFPVLIALMLLLCIPRPEAISGSCESEHYAVAASRTVWFYSNPDENSGLFLIPYTYYVRILEYGSPFCKVEYGEDVAPYSKVTGYCKTDAITEVNFVPARPTLRKQITLTYTLSDAFGGTFDAVEKDFLYFGDYYRGTACYWYVCSEGKFGYVPAEGVLEYDLNYDYLPEGESGEQTSEGGESARKGLTPVQIVLICLAAVAAVAVAAFVLFGKKPKPRDAGDFI